MTGLIILVILVPVIFLILLTTILNRTSSQNELLESLNKKVKKLSDQLYELSNSIKENPQTAHEKLKEDQEKIIIRTTELKKEEFSKVIIPEPEKKVVPEQETVPAPEEKIITPLTAEQKPIITDRKPQQPVENSGWWSKWMQNNPDLEKFIGENLANKIGIAILVLGISFFVKYAIDKDWINETGRVIIGLACGAVLIGVAHYFRNAYRSFSSVLAGGAMAVFYFTIAYAFHQYQLIGQQAAFIIMIVITAFAVVLSLLYDRLELAILAVIGGFITPFLVSTGQNNYVALFTYLCILNAGVMVLAYFKKWPAINSISLIFTVIIFGGWLASQLINSDNNAFPYRDAMLFASLFYVIFMCMNIVNNIRLKKSFQAFDFIIVLSTNFLFFAAGMLILGYWNNGDYKGLFTALLGAINLGLAWLFFRNTKADKNFIYLLIGLTLTFISLAAPIQLKGNHITLFWSAEAVVLFWLFQQSRIKLIKIASVLVSVLMLISLLMDWSQLYFSGKILLPVIANKGFITSLVSAAALFIYFLLMKKEADSWYIVSVTNKAVRRILLVSSLTIAYLSGALEVWYQFGSRIPEVPVYTIYLQLYTFTFTTILLFAFRNYKNNGSLRLLLTLFCFVLLLVYLGEVYNVLQYILTNGQYKVHFIAHWISSLLLFKLLYDLIAYFRTQNQWKLYETVFTWIAATALLILLSVEVHHLIMYVNYSSAENWVYLQNLYYKAGLSILWGVCSFIMMWLGMKHKFRTLRIISLTLFTITLVKLFGYDIRNIPPGGKIAAFILLGVLLLVISFMYQRLKKMIIDDSKEEK